MGERKQKLTFKEKSPGKDSSMRIVYSFSFPEGAENILKSYRLHCKEHKLSQSKIILALIATYLQSQNMKNVSPQKEAGKQTPRLEMYLTSQKNRFKERSKKLDEEWRARKK